MIYIYIYIIYILLYIYILYIYYIYVYYSFSVQVLDRSWVGMVAANDWFWKETWWNIDFIPLIGYWFTDTHYVDLLFDRVLQIPSTGFDLGFARYFSCIVVWLPNRIYNWKMRRKLTGLLWIHQAGLSPRQCKKFAPSFNYDLAGSTVALQGIED